MYRHRVRQNIVQLLSYNIYSSYGINHSSNIVIKIQEKNQNKESVTWLCNDKGLSLYYTITISVIVINYSLPYNLHIF